MYYNKLLLIIDIKMIFLILLLYESINAREGWQHWQAWSDCPDIRCGILHQTRIRECRPSIFGINNCIIDKEEEKQICAEKEECTHFWTGWTEWSSCSVTCMAPGIAGIVYNFTIVLD